MLQHEQRTLDDIVSQQQHMNHQKNPSQAEDRQQQLSAVYS
jgi:hypothetical protein